MARRIAQHRGAEQVIGVDLVPERLARARAHGVETLDLERAATTSPTRVRELTGGRGPDARDRRGRHGGARRAGRPSSRSTLAGLLPDAVAQQVMQTAGVDRLAALHTAIELVRRGGTDLALRRLRRRGRPAADAADVRQADHAADGPGQRPALGRRHPAAARPTTTTRSASTSFATHHLPLERGAGRPTRCSRRRRTAPSRWCSSPEGLATADAGEDLAQARGAAGAGGERRRGVVRAVAQPLQQLAQRVRGAVARRPAQLGPRPRRGP